ncbi:MAG: hypothetical protein KatS3mg051_0153 [Anaerolineae bacterium]|nr:MAG: hypothetical protein KatS3mg051_0153 [Anaerolineae bacterium]
MKQFFEEFKQFAMRGNVIDLAVGIIIGVAFNGVVSSLVNDIIMPPIGYLLNDIDFSNLYINLSGGDYSSLAAAKEAGAATINYGMFSQCRAQLHHCGLRGLPAGQADEPSVQGKARAARRADDQGMPLLPHSDSHRGGALPQLHVAPGRKARRSVSGHVPVSLIPTLIAFMGE